MQCPRCNCKQVSKNGHHRGKQRYKCKQCGRQFLEGCKGKGYTPQIKENCLKMYVNGMGFRAIERVMGVHHTTIINSVKQIGDKLDNAPPTEKIPDFTQIDELQSFIGKKADAAHFLVSSDLSPFPCQRRFGFGLQ